MIDRTVVQTVQLYSEDMFKNYYPLRFITTTLISETCDVLFAGCCLSFTVVKALNAKAIDDTTFSMIYRWFLAVIGGFYVTSGLLVDVRRIFVIIEQMCNCVFSRERLTTSHLRLFKQHKCMIQQRGTTHKWRLWLSHRVLLPSIHCLLMPQLYTKLQNTHSSMTRRQRRIILWLQQLRLLSQALCIQQYQLNQSIKRVCDILDLMYIIIIITTAT